MSEQRQWVRGIATALFDQLGPHGLRCDHEALEAIVRIVTPYAPTVREPIRPDESYLEYLHRTGAVAASGGEP